MDCFYELWNCRIQDYWYGGRERLLKPNMIFADPPDNLELKYTDDITGDDMGLADYLLFLW
ncbi:hypothetical protein LCGC14_2271580, partial [marine sediment metagenome]